MTLSNAILEYLPSLTVTQGPLAGQSLEVLAWQKRFIRGAFSPGTDRAAISVARKNGKSTLVASFGAASIDGPLAFPRGETLIVASSFEQGRIAFEHVVGFMGDKLEDKKRYRVWDTAQQARIEDRQTGARVRCLGSDPARAHGLAPTLVLMDEPAQWPRTTGERMLSALTTAMGAHSWGLMIALGTQPDDPEHWFSGWLHSGRSDYSQIHAAKSDAPVFQRRTWARANPSLDAMPALEHAIRAHSELARKDSSELASFKALRLNQGVSDTVEAVLLDSESWRAVEVTVQPARTGKLVVGIDLGTNAAMSAAAAYWTGSGAVDAFAVLPEIPSLAVRGIADGVGAAYVKLANRGEVIQAGGNVSDIPTLLRTVLDRWGTPDVIVCDRWREKELRDALDAVGWNQRTEIVVRGMGFKDGAEDCRLFVRAVLDDKVTCRVNALIRFALGGARTVSDPSGNAKLSKGTQGGRRSTHRDDAAAALILAVAEGVRRPDTKRARYLGLVG